MEKTLSMKTWLVPINNLHIADRIDFSCVWSTREMMKFGWIGEILSRSMGIAWDGRNVISYATVEKPIPHIYIGLGLSHLNRSCSEFYNALVTSIMAN